MQLKAFIEHLETEALSTAALEFLQCAHMVLSVGVGLVTNQQEF